MTGNKHMEKHSKKRWLIGYINNPSSQAKKQTIQIFWCCHDLLDGESLPIILVGYPHSKKWWWRWRSIEKHRKLTRNSGLRQNHSTWLAKLSTQWSHSFNKSGFSGRSRNKCYYKSYSNANLLVVFYSCPFAKFIFYFHTRVMRKRWHL